MTNKEILKADLLDIIFENRNKAYGAYALRRTYDSRLLWGLGIGLGIVLFISLMLSQKQKKAMARFTEYRELTVRTEDLPAPKPKEPIPPKASEAPPVARVKSLTNIQFVPENVPTDIPTVNELENAIPSNETVAGKLPSDIVTSANTGTGDKGKADNKSGDEPFNPRSSEAQYPGGKEAFANFLSKYLNTPSELEVGEKKIVLVRFLVDADGSISKAEIVQSDGEIYSREVLRVLRKMPKWIPAMQNGTNVGSWFTQPVTFIGIE